MRTIYRDVVAAVLISSDNKILLGKTALDAHGAYSGSWVIPGGGIEPGETPLQALVREIQEETNIDITPYEITLVEGERTGESTKKLKDSGEVVLCKMNFGDYVVKITDKTAAELGDKPTEELVQLRWFNLDELAQEQLSIPTKDLLEDIGLLK